MHQHVRREFELPVLLRAVAALLHVLVQKTVLVTIRSVRCWNPGLDPDSHPQGQKGLTDLCSLWHDLKRLVFHIVRIAAIVTRNRQHGMGQL